MEESLATVALFSKFTAWPSSIEDPISAKTPHTVQTTCARIRVGVFQTIVALFAVINSPVSTKVRRRGTLEWSGRARPRRNAQPKQRTNVGSCRATLRNWADTVLWAWVTRGTDGARYAGHRGTPRGRSGRRANAK